MKSSASADGPEKDCVEVATTADRVHVRDSKHPHPSLSFTRETWRMFLGSRRS
ncbi:DUF397 domain-containing protein [Amycolatopsis tolypomycina]|uniref:DUF397 domain-containing protein n=1 Tax=Amycolatopsis tolypomycina TaxID=208445 RepID=UPI001FC9A35B|nr:DUF397 domain-containing protein [Amycolatopsis tolypomycina]